MTKFFVIGEIGDAGVWLVDVEDKSVRRIEEADLASDLPDGDPIVDLNRARMTRSESLFQGVNLVVATASRSGPSSHSYIDADRGETPFQGVNLAVASASRSGPSSHSYIDADRGETPFQGVNLAVASASRSSSSAHNRIEAAR